MWDWHGQLEFVRAQLASEGIEASSLGERTAMLATVLYGGWHHVPRAHKVDWSDPYVIRLPLDNCLATVDFDRLTKLVFFAHLFCLRVEIDCLTKFGGYALVHRRERTGSISNRHPTLSEAVEKFEEKYGMDEIPWDVEPKKVVTQKDGD